MKIIQASYGCGIQTAEVTERLQECIRNHRLFLRVNDGLFTNPCPGHPKTLRFSYEVPGQTITFYHEAKEQELVHLPVTTTDKAGIFYTNLAGPPKYIDRVLAQIEKAAQDVDVYTCPWRPIPGNPFPELSWNYHVTSHLTLLLQILKLLYTIRDLGQYEYVFFLEQDVLYPEGYFTFAPFEGDVLLNTNYIGLNEKGFQAKRPHSQQPLHQLLIRLPAAISHFEARLPVCLTRGSLEIEPYDLSWQEREAENPAVHINHGFNFTSHYRIYSPDDISETHPYWGTAQSWWE